MATIRTRYPGAQPFADDPFSRSVFFGRDQASKELTDQILANRIVVVFAKSGLGKTSLLNAGVAPRLRDEGHLPLFARVNDVERSPLQSVLDAVQGEAERQGVEYSPGQRDSLWSFFKTAEFWRNDLLLTPVLVLDQFEELFTLHTEAVADTFLSELGSLVRGIRPDSPGSERLSETAPLLRLVLSLREDYLGLLEEAADHLPQILDHRFRVAPLNVEGAAAAITGPAEIQEAAFRTRPFAYEPNAVAAILNYLSRQRQRTTGRATRYVEPFQLQLICQEVERNVSQREQTAPGVITVTLDDIGGEERLRKTLQNFYNASLRALPGLRVRRAVRRLCEEVLISPEGRRLSLEEEEILRQLPLAADTLRSLVAVRLLRSDTRSDSVYYELSHDALIEPVLATRRWRALAIGWTGLIVPALVLAAFIAIDISLLVSQGVKESLYAAAFVVPLTILLVALSARNLRSLRRHRSRTWDELTVAGQARRSRLDATCGALGLLAGSYLVLVAPVIGVWATAVALGPHFSPAGRLLPESFSYMEESVVRDGLGLDTIASLISAPVVLIFGVRAIRWGASKLLQAPRRSQSPATATLGAGPMRRAASGGLAAVAAVIVLLVAVVLVLSPAVDAVCARSFGRLPVWIPGTWFNSMEHDCQEAFEKGYDWAALLLSVPFVVALLVEAGLLVRRGFREVRGL